MVRGVCPACEALVKITPTGKAIAPNWSSKFWRVVMHARDGKVCDGSGKLI